jgi:hypothetical protein
MSGTACRGAAAALAILAFAGCGTPESVMRDLRSPNAYNQLHGINEIITAGAADDEALPLLARLMESPLGNVSARAAFALGSLGERGVPALARALKNSDAEVRWKAAWGLTTAGPAAQGALPALIGALRDSDALVRQQAAQALGRTGAREAVPALKARFAEEDDPQAREAMNGALRMLGDSPRPAQAGPTRVIQRRGGIEEGKGGGTGEQGTGN